MSAKILVSGESNSGKTTLLSSLVDAFIVSHDGKNFPFPIPHVNISSFSSADEFISIVMSKVQAYKDKYEKLPRTIAFDSVSKIFDTLYDVCLDKHTGFKAYTELDKEIHKITEFIQQLVNEGINIVILSHAIWDSDNAKFNLIGKGSFAKRGGFLAETDNAVFVETKNGKRIIHNRSTKFPARSILSSIEDSTSVENYNLQTHVEQLEALKDSVAAFCL